MKKIVAMILLGASLVACALILVKPNVIFRHAGGINVKGYAVERVMSDAATWDARLSATEATEALAYAKIKKSTQTAREFLLKAGAKEAALTFSAAIINPVYKMDKGARTNSIEQYTATVAISYSDDDIKTVTALAAKANELIESGVSISSSDPQYYYTKIEDLKLSLIEKASSNARERAERLTSGSNSTLGKIMSASQGIFQITRPLSNETSDWGMYDTSSQAKDVRCVVTVEFAIEK